MPHPPIYLQYAPDGRSIATRKFNNGSSDVLVVTNSHDGLGRLLSVRNQTAGGSVISSAAYDYNAADQRTRNTLADGSYWVYQYDSLGQVISGKKYFADGSPVNSQQYGYEFDTIGNRTSASEGLGSDLRQANYTANELNQYESRTVLGRVMVAGTAASGAMVSVRLGTNAAVLTSRHGAYFWRSVDATNSAGLYASTNVQVVACLTQVQGTNTNSLVRTEARSALLARTPEQFTYDSDGNLLKDGLWTNTWDAENRLVQSESLPAVPESMRALVRNQYDATGRRVRKTVCSGFANDVYASTNVTTFVWSGWLPVAEVSASPGSLAPASTNLFFWGPDLSGSLEGAGGIGGLALLSLCVTNCSPMWDGNGNVMGLVDATGTKVAEYEYSPFGETLKAAGPNARANHFRFSTKCTDPKLDWCITATDIITRKWAGGYPGIQWGSGPAAI